MQREILEEHPQADIRVYAVWFNVLFSDDRSEWSDSLLTDPRVTELWDDAQAVSRMFADREELNDEVFGPIAWDMFFLFGPEAVWDDVPSPVVSSGRTVIGKSRHLKSTIVPLLDGE